MIESTFWEGKHVFITGHTGFKGSWLTLWLHTMGAKVTGYALPPPTDPNMFDLCRIDQLVASRIADVRDLGNIKASIAEARPEIVFHLAAQPLVRESYRDPAGTYGTNVLGTVNVLEGIRSCVGVKAFVNVTTDKCYENREWVWGYRENEPLGGYDPYSSSKACSELVTAAYRASYFNPGNYEAHGVGIASARAGNVIGGGDWAENRLVPDCIRSILKGERIRIRSPKAIRPWQHVLESLGGYLLLARKLYEEGPRFAGAWNFGPLEDDSKTVEWVVKKICERWGGGVSYEIDPGPHPHEAHYLKLDCSKAKTDLCWKSRWNVELAIDKVIEWYTAYSSHGDLRMTSMGQIKEYANFAIGNEDRGGQGAE